MQQFVVYNQHHQNKFTVTRKQRECSEWLLVPFLLRMQCFINLSTPSPKNFELHVTTLHSQIVCISFCINLHKYFSSSVENIEWKLLVFSLYLVSLLLFDLKVCWVLMLLPSNLQRSQHFAHQHSSFDWLWLFLLNSKPFSLRMVAHHYNIYLA